MQILLCSRPKIWSSQGGQHLFLISFFLLLFMLLRCIQPEIFFVDVYSQRYIQPSKFKLKLFRSTITVFFSHYSLTHFLWLLFYDFICISKCLEKFPCTHSFGIVVPLEFYHGIVSGLFDQYSCVFNTAQAKITIVAMVITFSLKKTPIIHEFACKQFRRRRRNFSINV